METDWGAIDSSLAALRRRQAVIFIKISGQIVVICPKGKYGIYKFPLYLMDGRNHMLPKTKISKGTMGMPPLIR